MNRTYDFVLVVAGILGASTAYHLKRYGVERVALLERRGPDADVQAEEGQAKEGARELFTG